MRKRYDKEFKAKLAIEALRGEKTIQEIAIAYGVHPNLVTSWKKQLLDGLTSFLKKQGRIRMARRQNVSRTCSTSRLGNYR
ncbi:MAG: transposase [Spirochaetes bacterium]|nr:transposase [Spirochaetota bacterium]